MKYLLLITVTVLSAFTSPGFAGDAPANSTTTSASNSAKDKPFDLEKRLTKMERKLDTILTFEDKIDEMLAFIRKTRDSQAKQTPSIIAKEKQEQASAAADNIVDEIETAIANDDSDKANDLIDAARAKGFDVNYNPSGRKSQTLLAAAKDEGLDSVVQHLKQLGAKS